jgi:MFS family permease
MLSKIKNDKNLFFILLIGIVSLFADMTYEGARSITGPYLSLLGASAAAVGFVSGLGEFIGYGIRLLSGIVADKTKKYWTITILGYIINLIAVPALALAGNWYIAAVLMVCERFGKAIRNPSRDVILSQATAAIGHGKGFGIHEALDQIGAITGPLIVSFVLYFSGNYKISFLALLFPALLAISVLLIAKNNYSKNDGFKTIINPIKSTELKKIFWLYLTAISLIAIGFADYPLIAFHFSKTGQTAKEWIPVLYAIAMGVDALAALLLGKLFDKHGIKILIVTTLISAFFAPLVFQGNFYTAMLGMVCWGIGMAALESVVKAFLATILPSEKKATGFGIFYAVFGFFWFIGSFIMGSIYDISILWLILFSIGMQLASIPFFIILVNKNQ